MQTDTIGCESCHRATFIAGTKQRPCRLRHQTIHPNTDLLLHDMGFELAEQVNGHTRFMHDGRVRNSEEAMLWYGGEAETIKPLHGVLSH